MKTINTSLLFILALSTSTGANAAGSMLRVTCEGNDIGAEVLINGKFKGECPMDVQVPVGTSKLLVQKKIGDEDRMFEQEFRMGDGGVKKIEVQLVSKFFLSRVKKAEAGDIGEMGSVALIYKIGARGVPKNMEQYFKWTRKRAEAGVAEAMVDLGQAYQEGTGVEINMDEANRWYGRGLEITRNAAENGNTSAMLQLGTCYAIGKGVSKDRGKGLMWIHKAKDKGDKAADNFLEVMGEH